MTQSTPTNRHSDLPLSKSFQTKLAALKREEESLKGEEDWLNVEKTKLIRTLKLIHEEDGSRFNNCPVMAGCDGRFVLTTLLGRGGFSEVYKVSRDQSVTSVCCTGEVMPCLGVQGKQRSAYHQCVIIT